MFQFVALLFAIFIHPIAWPGWTIEWIVRKWTNPDWQISPASATPYLGTLAVIGTILVMYGGPVLIATGAYLVTAMFVLCLWICVAITIGKPNSFYYHLSTFGRRSNLNMRPLKLMRPETLYVGIVSFGYTVYYFALAGYLIHRIWPDSYSGINSTSPPELLWEFFYFSVVTVTTLGYGDISPKSTGAQVLTVLEVGAGLFFVLFVFGSFVSFYFSRLKEE